MNEETLKLLQNLSKMLGADRVLVKDEVDAVLGGIFKLLAEYKKTTDAMNGETRALVDKALNSSLDFYEKTIREVSGATKKQAQFTDEAIAKVEKQAAQSIEEIKYLISQIQLVTPRDGMDADEQAIIERVLETLKANEKNEKYELNATEIADAINCSENDTDKIDWERIKNVPAAVLSPKSTNGGNWQMALRNAVDLDMSTKGDGYAIVWDEARGRFKLAAGGGGGGSGTVNSGTQYNLAFYSATGTAVSGATGLIWNSSSGRFGINTSSAPSYQVHLVTNTAGGGIMFERSTSLTNSPAGVTRHLATSSGDMADGFGTQMVFAIKDTAAVENTIAIITATRANGLDTDGSINLIPQSGGASVSALSAHYNGNVSVGSATSLGSRLDITTTRSAANTGNVGVNFCTRTGTFTDTSSSGAVASILGNSFYAPTFAASAATTYTDSATVYISAAPTAGTNATLTNTYALWVDSGVSRFDGVIRYDAISTGNTIAAFDASKNLTFLATSTYPSLTEIAYVKGVTSAIQTQLDTKISAASTNTLTNKRITRRIQTVTSSATVTPSFDNDDDVVITAQAAGLTIANPTGTPTDGQVINIRLKDNGTSQTIAFGASYRAIGVTLPTATTISKTVYIGCRYNSADSKMDVVALAQEA